MDIFNNYALELKSDNKKINEYITKLSSLNEKNIKNKINLVEQQYQYKLKELETINKEEFLESFKINNSLVILQKELEIIKLLTQYTLQNKNLNYNFFYNSLNLLLELSEILRNRLNQEELIHKSHNDILLRCSYKFCPYQSNCSYNYNFDSYKLNAICYSDHYVHNMVSADIKILLDYISNKYSDNNIIIHNKDILKTIHTLSFVIGHMESELKTKCLYLPNNKWDACHIVKNKNHKKN
jgi:hypothetical protein